MYPSFIWWGLDRGGRRSNRSQIPKPFPGPYYGVAAHWVHPQMEPPSAASREPDDVPRRDQSDNDGVPASTTSVDKDPTRIPPWRTARATDSAINFGGIGPPRVGRIRPPTPRTDRP